MRCRAAVVGLGYWGPNLARNLVQSAADYELVALCDSSPARLARLGSLYPSVAQFADVGDMLASANVDLVCVATPVASHHSIARAALNAGANVLCEKPLTSTVEEAEDLVQLARARGKRLFVDHTFAYTPAVRAIRAAYQQRVLGSLFYVDSVRINLGLFQADVDVVWDLAPHDLSILSYVLGERAVSVKATGSSHNPHGLTDVAYLTVGYEGGMEAHLHLSWLSPVKVRRMIFSGTDRSLIYDDLDASEKVRIYDHGVNFDVADVEARKRVLVSYRRGEMRAPALDTSEALAVELREIAAALRGESATVTTGDDGLEVVRVLRAAATSLANDGARVAT